MIADAKIFSASLAKEFELMGTSKFLNESTYEK